MTYDYAHGFICMCASKGVPKTAVEPLLKLSAASAAPAPTLTDRQLAAVMEMVRLQQEDRDRVERQRKARFARNRAEQLRERRIKGSFIGGALGAGLGALTGAGTAAGFPLTVVGGALGAIGGRMLGTSLGNRDADRMEAVEDETGVSVAQQSADRDANRAKNLALVGLLRRR